MMRRLFRRLSIYEYFNVITALMFLILSYSCGTKIKQAENEAFKSFYFGEYVTESYFQRKERSDWMSIFVDKKDDSTAIISIRSRADIKKPTCTFDANAEIIHPHTLKSYFEKKEIIFTFLDSQLEISVLNSKDEGVLSFFCSGGGSIKGTYIKLEDSIDVSQLTYTDFEKRLSLQGISFQIKSINTGFSRELTIIPENLEIDNRPVRHKIMGNISGAEVEDLNSDGSPELLVYIQTLTDGLFGDVIGYSVNNKKSMSQIYFPGVKDDATLNQGYFGYDEFSVVETKLVQRFPIFKEDHGILIPENKMRQISYRLSEGEAQRRFEVDAVTEY